MTAAGAKKQPRTYKYYGANMVLQNGIRKLAAEGHPVAVISERLNIDPKCVDSFMPKDKPKTPKKMPPRKKKYASNDPEGKSEAESWEG